LHLPQSQKLTLTQPQQYFKSIEKVAASQGFEQILPSAIRTGPRPQQNHVDPLPEVKEEPSIQAPQPLTSTLLAAPATEYPLRSHSPDLIPDRMGARIAAY
jgi:glucosamine-6-phosphate deaminase